jgi:hypothetical protein
MILGKVAMRRGGAVGLAIWLVCSVGSCGGQSQTRPVQRLHTFYLEGGFFYGPGPIVPDTPLPEGRLAGIRFDADAWRGFCQFENDGARTSLLSDGRTRINQNIDAGHLLIGGGTSPVLLAAVDGGPHQGTEQYYLDDRYRFIWRVDIALDPGFADGIIRLDDFVLTTDVVRIAESLQAQAGQPGGYDQAGSLRAGEFLAGRVGDFNHDGYLDGILVAAPNVPMVADMLPGAPVGNRRGFRTDVPIAASVSAELMLRGILHLRDPILTSLKENSAHSARALLAEMRERLEAVSQRAIQANVDNLWRDAAAANQFMLDLKRTQALSAELLQFAHKDPLDLRVEAVRSLYREVEQAIERIAHLNSSGRARLPAPGTLAAHVAAMEPRPKSD